MNGPYRAGVIAGGKRTARQEKTDGNFRTAKKREAEDDAVKSL